MYRGEIVDSTKTKVKIRIAYSGKNRSGYDFSKEMLNDMIPSIKGSPIVAHYMEEHDVIGGHEGDYFQMNGKYFSTKETQPYGFVSETEEPFWENHKDNDGVEREYLTTFGYLWSDRYPQATKQIADSGQSMEIKIIEAKEIDGYISVSKGEVLGLCALGKGLVEPTFEGADIVKFSKDNYINLSKQIEEMRKEFEEITSFAFDKEKIGSGEKIDFDVSTESAINGEVGKKNTQDIKRDVMMAKNFKMLAKKVFLLHPYKITKDTNLSDLGYPVMFKQDGVYKYHLGLIKAAGSRLEQNSNQEYYETVKKRLNSLREKFDMEKLTTFSNEEGGEIMDKTQMKEMYGKFGAMFIKQEEGFYHGFSMEDMKPVKLACGKDEEGMAIPEGEVVEGEEMSFSDEEIMMITKLLYEMLKEKEMGYETMSKEKEDMTAELAKKDEELKAKDSEKEKELKAKDEELEEKLSLKDSEIESIKEQFSKDQSALQGQISEMSTEIEGFKLSLKQNKVNEILNESVFSILSDVEKQAFVEQVTSETDLDEYRVKIESFSFKKEKSIKPVIVEKETFSNNNMIVNTGEVKELTITERMRKIRKEREERYNK
jgi:hypothetical protein